jgi:hypothetical protein
MVTGVRSTSRLEPLSREGPTGEGDAEMEAPDDREPRAKANEQKIVELLDASISMVPL